MINLHDFIVCTLLPETLFPLTLVVGDNSPVEGIRLQSKLELVVSQGELCSLIKSGNCVVYISNSVPETVKELISKLLDTSYLVAKAPKHNKINLEFTY